MLAQTGLQQRFMVCGSGRSSWPSSQYRVRLASLATVVALLVPATAVAGEALPDPCKELGAGYHAVPGLPACAFFRADIKSDYRSRSTRNEISVETSRTPAGPQLAYSLDRLRPDRPSARYLIEAKPLLRVGFLTDSGPVTISFGVKYQRESPPRRRNDPANEFNRTGERLTIEHANIQFAGLALGIAPSFFDFTPSLSYTTLYASEQSVPLVAYTYKAGATDFTLSIENGSYRRLSEAPWGGYVGKAAPDVVGAVRRHHDWGNIQVAGALHTVRAFQPLACCAPAAGEALGWAAMAGVESWFDVAGMSGEALLNLGVSRGALSYIGATNYPADFALSRDGTVFMTTAQAIAASYAHWWTKEIRTVATFSGFRTALDTDTFSLHTEGLRLQGALEFYPRIVPRRGLLLGAEVNYHDERVRGTGPWVANRYASTVLYVRQRFQP